MEERLNVSWQQHPLNLIDAINDLHSKDVFCDVTIACSGEYFPAHRLVLCCQSDYFRELLERAPCRHPFIILRDTTADVFESLMQFIYKGSVEVPREKVPLLMKAGTDMRIKGLYSSEDSDDYRNGRSVSGTGNLLNKDHSTTESYQSAQSTEESDKSAEELRYIPNDGRSSVPNDESQVTYANNVSTVRTLPPHYKKRSFETYDKTPSKFADQNTLKQTGSQTKRSRLSTSEANGKRLNQDSLKATDDPSQLLNLILTHPIKTETPDLLDEEGAQITHRERNLREEPSGREPNSPENEGSPSPNITSSQPSRGEGTKTDIKMEPALLEFNTDLDEFENDKEERELYSRATITPVTTSQSSYPSTMATKNAEYTSGPSVSQYSRNTRTGEDAQRNLSNTDEIESFLNRWGLEELIPQFREERIKFTSLTKLKECHIQQLNLKIGQQVQLQYAIEKVKDEASKIEKVMGTPNKTSLSEQSRPCMEVTREEELVEMDTGGVPGGVDLPMDVRRPLKKKTKSFCYMVSQMTNLEDLLKETPTGEAILSFYRKNGKLVDDLRKKLVNIIIEKAMSQSYNIRENDFYIMASEIVRLFPKENKEIYFMSSSERNGKCSAGKLVTYYKNQRAKFIRMGFIEKNSKEPTIDQGRQPLNVDADMEECVRWLQLNSGPWDEVVQKWQKTSPLRVREIDTSNWSFSDICNKWPLFKHPQCDQLINLDFSQKYPGRDVFAQMWPDLSDRLVDLMKAKFHKEAETMLGLNTITEPPGRDLIIFELLHKLLRPSVINPKRGEVQRWHPSALDSRECFMLYIPDMTCMEDRIAEKKQQLREKNLTLQPLILYGHDFFFAYIEGVYYKFPTVVDTVTFLFKAYMVLNLKFPLLCEAVWQFIQHGIFKITTRYDIKKPNVSCLISECEL